MRWQSTSFIAALLVLATLLASGTPAGASQRAAPLAAEASSFDTTLAARATIQQQANLPQVSAGGYRTCVINRAGQLYCWGRNSSIPADLGPVVQVSAGGYHTCAITTANTLHCWGDNTHGQASVPADLGPVVQVSAGFLHTCAITTANTLRCWGRNDYGQASVPADLGPVVQVSAGGGHTCAITPANTLRCWGSNWAGQATAPADLGPVVQVSVGNNHTCAITPSNTLRCWGGTWDGQATAPADLGLVSQVSAGFFHTCAITTANTLRCWTYGDYGQANVPADLGPVVQVSAGFLHTCAITTANTLRCWGYSNLGEATVPTDPGPVSQVSAEGDHTCAITTANTLRCWGRNDYGQATAPTDLGPVVQVSAGGAHTCAITTANILRCWGRNDYGQASVPADLGPVVQVSAGGAHTCAITPANILRCWGLNGNGQASVPADLGPVVQVSAGGFHTCAITTANTLRCWGRNDYGQANVPADLGPVVQVSAGYYHTCAITTANTLRCWGLNGNGQASVPADLGPVVQVSVGGDHTCAITTANTLRCWGGNFRGQASAPADLGPVNQVSAGWEHTCAITTADALRCWGSDLYGQTTVPRDPLGMPPPEVQSITRAGANPTSAASVAFTVTFSEAVTGVDAADFALTTSGSLSGVSVSAVSGGPTVYAVTVNTGSGNGALRLDVRAEGTGIVDAAGNPLASGFTGGEAYTVERTLPSPTPPPTPDDLRIIELLPPDGPAGTANTVSVFGAGFTPAIQAFLGDLPIPVVYQSDRLLQLSVPETLPVGAHTLTLRRPDGRSITHADAYTVIGSTVNDDLFAYSLDLFTVPSALSGDTPFRPGLLVTRRGGRSTLTEVEVAFYRLEAGGARTLLGTTTIPLLGPRSQQVALAPEVGPLPPGEHTLEAVIDPQNRIAEDTESNNALSRTLTVLPASPGRDQLAPRVTSFIINGGASLTPDRAVSLDITASDPTTPPPSSGVASVRVLEFRYNPAVGRWLPAQDSGWQPYTGSPTTLAWTLTSEPGLRYLLAWAADRAGNISVAPFQRLLNYAPPTVDIRRDQAHTYRYTLQAGQVLRARLESVSGDADLYVWPPEEGAPPAVSNLSGAAVDVVELLATHDGVYQVEVYGYTDATYRLTAEIGPSGAALAHQQAGGIDPTKPLRSAPATPQRSTPAETVGLSLPPAQPSAGGGRVYLPLVLRR